MKPVHQLMAIAAAGAACLLSACGGGGGGTPMQTSSGATVSGASAGATSSGTVTAFGSIFVNGHEFNTAAAKVIDDDTGATTTGTAALEVGMSVDVKASSRSTESSPEAAEVHIHPLVRGVVDGSDLGAGTLTVMGQTVQLTAATSVSDHRACVTAATSPCTPVTGQSGLLVTAGSGSSAVPGSYVTVHGFLFSANPAAVGANVVATLVSVGDAPTGPVPAAYKAEGVVSAVGTGTVTIGGLTVGLATASCSGASGSTDCSTAFSVGQVVSAFGKSAPPLPATTFDATTARLRTKLAVQTPGAAVEIEGRVSQVGTAPAMLVVRGVTVDTAAIVGALPAVGDLVEVTGTLASDGSTVTASAVKVLHGAHTATFGLAADVTSVTTGASANTFELSMLGQSIEVTADTHLMDSTRPSTSDPTTNPFNITTFQTYLAASASQHLIVSAQADSTGALTALSLAIVPASTVSSVGGIVDTAPAPVNSSVTGTPSTFSVHGLAVSADPASVFNLKASHESHGFGDMSPTAGGMGSVQAGDYVLVAGLFAGGTLTVTAPVASTSQGWSKTNAVLDMGVGGQSDNHDGF